MRRYLDTTLIPPVVTIMMFFVLLLTFWLGCGRPVRPASRTSRPFGRH